MDEERRSREAQDADEESAEAPRERGADEESTEAPRGKDARKPLSVRDAVGPPGMRGQRPRPTGGRRASGRPADAPPSARPTPVRKAMGAPALEDVLADPDELPSRTLEAEGERWIAREGGSTRAGHPDDRGAPLVQVVYYREDDPGVPVREGLLVGTSLEAMDEERLREGLRRSREVPEDRRPGKSVST